MSTLEPRVNRAPATPERCHKRNIAIKALSNEEVPLCRILLPDEVFLPGTNLKMILHDSKVYMCISGH